jgi:hypothetical protein
MPKRQQRCKNAREIALSNLSRSRDEMIPAFTRFDFFPLESLDFRHARPIRNREDILSFGKQIGKISLLCLLLV